MGDLARQYNAPTAGNVVITRDSRVERLDLLQAGRYD